MDTNKLTTKSRDAVSAALRNALTAGNPNAEPSHLLHALLMVPGNTVAPLLQGRPLLRHLRVLDRGLPVAMIRIQAEGQ